MFRCWCGDARGLPFVTELAKRRPVRLLPMAGGIPAPGLSKLLLTPVTEPWCNLVIAAAGTMVGATRTAADFQPSAADLAMGGRVRATPEQVALLTAQMGMAPAAREVVIRPACAFSSLFTAGVVNLAFIVGDQALSDVELDALGRFYQIVCGTHESHQRQLDKLVGPSDVLSMVGSEWPEGILELLIEEAEILAGP